MGESTNNKRYAINPNIYILPLILLAVLLAVGSAIWGDYRDRIMENQKNQLLLTSRALGENMSLSLMEYQDNLEFLSNVSNEDEEFYRQFLETQSRFEEDLFWENPQGEIVKSIRNMEWSSPVLVTQISQEKSIWQYDGPDGGKYLVFKEQLDSGEALCLAVNEEKYYQQLISDIQIGTNGYIMVKNSDGLILMHPEKNQWGIHVIEGRRKMFPDLDYTSLEAMVKEQCSGDEGITEYYSYWWSDPELPRVKKISAYAPAEVGEDFWVISAVVDYDDLYDPIEAGFRQLSLLFIGALLALIVLFLFIGKLLLDRKRTLEEIDALRELNERLEEVHQGEEMIAHQQRLQIMGTMTGGIAHEFNNFLTPIMGYAELLMMELPEDSEEYDSAQEIYEASEKAKDVIRQISSLSRRNVETVYKSIPVYQLLTRAARMAESICPVHVHLEKEIDVKEECILGNATQINQVLLNICVNAVHAIGKEEGRIRIHGTCVAREAVKQISELEAFRIPDDWKQYLEIDITDNGCGMESDTLRQIFTPFFTTKKAGEGTGLGLALAEQIILSHKGYIYAESEVGKGSIFHIFLPIMESNTDIESLTMKQREEFRIVVADDNAKVLQMLEKNFAKLNLFISTCRKKSELHGLLEKEEPDVLVIDESLEDGSGIDFCMSIQGRYPGMKKIVMTDYFTKEIVEAKQKGVIDGYLAKPVSDTAILESIRNCQEEGTR